VEAEAYPHLRTAEQRGQIHEVDSLDDPRELGPGEDFPVGRRAHEQAVQPGLRVQLQREPELGRADRRGGMSKCSTATEVRVAGWTALASPGKRAVTRLETSFSRE
jgi:hypothetical protein